jgi:hypothetical protein
MWRGSQGRGTTACRAPAFSARPNSNASVMGKGLTRRIHQASCATK